MSTLQNNIASLEALITKANTLPEEKTIQSSKTVTPTTSSQTIKPDSGYDGMGQVVVNAVPTATQATPSVSIDSAGKITATATQSAGYVAAGTKTGTKQLTTQAAKTITPTKSSQTAVASGRYTTGAVTVAAIPSQYITTTDASAAADDIVTGETAYVNGVKVTGTNPYEKAATDTEVAAQATQIEEIMGLLEGKSVPGSGEGNNPTGGVMIGTMVGTTTLVAPPGQNTYYYSLEEFADRFLVVLKPVDTDANSHHIIMCRQNITDEFEVYSSYPSVQSVATISLSISDHVLAITTSLSQYNQVTYIAA